MYRSIVVLTGAGISAESGLKTFRGADGIWESWRAEDLATPEAFAANPSLVQRFYNERRRQLLSGEIQPNPAHRALAQLERLCGARFTLVTQNVDNLHELAGSDNILHMHGELLRARCTHCGGSFAEDHDLEAQTSCPGCAQIGSLRPDVVWFGEVPLHMDTIAQQLQQCDLFLSVGTSGTVYPAAGFVEQVPPGTRTIEVNLEPSLVQSRFTEHVYGRAGEVLPPLVDGLLAGAG